MWYKECTMCSFVVSDQDKSLTRLHNRNSYVTEVLIIHDAHIKKKKKRYTVKSTWESWICVISEKWLSIHQLKYPYLYIWKVPNSV